MNPTMNDPVKHLKEDQQQELRAIKGRQVSAASTLSTVSSTHDFVESKIEDVKIALEYNDKLRSGLKEAWSDGMIPNDVYQNLMEQIEHENRPREKEIVVLKRQKKFLIEDLDDSIRPVREKLEDAYASLIVDKVMSTTAKQKMKKSKFKREVLEYYHASKMINNKKHAWCHLLGWHDAEFIKAAHIVPKSLQSEEVSYLFGVGEAILSSPRNALSLLQNVEQALDKGSIVLVPVNRDNEIHWRCLVTDNSILPWMLSTGTHYKDIDGKELIFQGVNRPAKRYLYFRFVITYLHCKRAGNLEWIQKVEAKGQMWVFPGPYLRQSMLVSLARKVSNLYLPEAFYQTTTFTEANGCATRTKDEEEDLAMSLAVRVKEMDEMTPKRRHCDADDDEENEEEDDGTCD